MRERSAHPLRILFVEDQPDDIELESRQLARAGLEFDMRSAATEAELRKALEEFCPHIVLCDYSIPGFGGRKALHIAKELCPDTPFIFVSGTIGEETAIECLREGATDYVLKDNPRRLGPAVRRALDEVEERKNYEARIQHLANYDGLTELPNRTLLADRVGQAILNARRSHQGFSIITFTLDGWRLVNEGFGHVAGDATLRAIGERLRTSVRECDTLARTGVDEFSVLLPDIARPEDVHGYAQRIREVIRAPHSVAQTELHITASAGAAIFPEDGETFETLLHSAAGAARAAKLGGRDGFQFFSPEATRNALERIVMETELRQAPDRGTLKAHYQVQHELATGRVSGMEALVRWNRGGTMMSPAYFIPIAEQSGLIHAIGERVLEDACGTALPWVTASGNRLILGVNVSPYQLRDPTFIDRLRRVLGSTGFPVGCLELEITESALMADDFTWFEAIARLRDLGVKIAIDDFGTGYSSLSYLSRLPIDRLKIDGSFIGRMTTDPREAAIVQSIVELGHGLGLDVVAERVETREQREALRAMNCDHGQGYLFAPPLEAERVAERLTIH